MPSTDHLIWIDLEMTGLKPDTDHIIEIATIVTDRDLNLISEGPNLAIHQPDSVLAGMDDWNQKQHRASGLLARVKASTITTATAEQRTLAFLSSLVAPGATRADRNASVRCSAVAVVMVLDFTRASRPEARCCFWFQSSMPAKTESG